MSVGTESGGCGSVELVASRPETGHGDNAGTEAAPKAPPMLTTPATVPSDWGLPKSSIYALAALLSREINACCVFSPVAFAWNLHGAMLFSVVSSGL